MRSAKIVPGMFGARADGAAPGANVQRNRMMNVSMRILIATTVLALCPIIAIAQDGEIVVATRQVNLKSKTSLFKVVEAYRGDRWEIVKKSRGKIVLTLGPDDARWEEINDDDKDPTFEISDDDFRSAFVSEAEWPSKRGVMAKDLLSKYMDLSLEQCEKIIDGELWVGMKMVHAAEAVGNRVRMKSITDPDKNGVTEIWEVGYLSVKNVVINRLLILTLYARPTEPLPYSGSQSEERARKGSNKRAKKTLDNIVKYKLWFKNGEFVRSE